MQKFKLGQIVTGTVISIAPYGAFVRISDEIDGLIHISEISKRFVRNVSDYVKIGETIHVEILDVDYDLKQARLSIKNILPYGKKHYFSRPLPKNYSMNKKQNLEKLASNFDLLTNSMERWIKETYQKVGGLDMIQLDLAHAKLTNDFSKYQDKIQDVHNVIHQKTGAGNDYLGWLDWPFTYDEVELQRLIASAKRVRETCSVLVVCGIGGSYLGARAAIEMINGLYPQDRRIEIIYVGNTFSSTYTKQVLDYLKGKKFAINVISKSGTTTETSIAFRLLKELAIETYGKEYNKYIFSTTDAEKGVLRPLSEKENIETYVIPADIGGRYSVLTPVGLFPMAVAGIDVKEVLLGASKACELFRDPSIKTNVCYQYALARNLLLQNGKSVELFVSYEPSMVMFGEWLKQLFGESEGKDGKGIFPASASYSTDLHSLGQFVQDGTKLLFETLIKVDHPQQDFTLTKNEHDEDGLNYLAGKTLDFVSTQAYLGTLQAHEVNGNVPNIILHLDKVSAASFGFLSYFFMKACAVSGYLLGVNPFNQPGVEIYKKNMFQLLGKK